MFADENSEVDKMGRNFARWVENTMGKGEIAHYEQFLLFPQFFQKTCIADTYKPGLVWERVKGKTCKNIKSNLKSFAGEKLCVTQKLENLFFEW